MSFAGGLGIAAAITLTVLTGGRACAAADPAMLVRQVVLGIASFTRWPEPHTPLRLCLVGQPENAGALSGDDMQIGPVPLRPQHVASDDTRLGMACDIVYEGRLTQAERYRLGLAIMGHPVLTIGETGPGCVENTMFCLKAGGMRVTFSSNLDAIARSGVRLNPSVLLLGRRAQ